MSLKRRRFLARFSAAIIAAPACARAAATTQRPRVSLADLGGRPGTRNAAPLFAAALERLRQSGGVLHVPAGVWRFAQTEGIAVNVSGLDGLVIEGEGALLLFSGQVKPFVFTGCYAPVVRGLTIDWIRPPFSQGEVVGVGAGNRSAELQIDPDYPVDGSEVVRAMASYDRATGLMTRAGLDAYDAVDGVTRTGAQRLRLAFNRFLPLQAGDTVVLRHATYGANALSFIRCSGLAVEGVTIRSAPGMGVYADHCTGASVHRLEISVPPGSGRLMTTTADGLQFNACSGRIAVAGCVMSGMGDDGVNIHGKYFRIARRVDARTAVVATSPGALAGPPRQTPSGDRLEIVAAGSLQTRGSMMVTAAEPTSDGLTTLHLDHDLPPDIRVGDYVFDAETRSQVSVSGCRFPGNRARGVLVHSDAVIDKCHFSGQSAEAILLLPDARFMEGPAAERIVASGNEITGVLRSGHPSGAIRVDVAAGGEFSPWSVNRDVALIDNRFDEVGGPALLARSTTGLVFAGNRINRSSAPAIVLQDVRSVQISNNACAPASVIAVGLDEAAQVTLKGNAGLAVG